MGFRGEALFCLANLSGRLIIATRTAHDAMAEKLEFQRHGGLDTTSTTTTSTTEFLPRKIGTTVAVVRFLEAVPVRRAAMKRGMARQRAKLLQWMQQYAIFSLRVRLHLMDVVQVTPWSSSSSQSQSQQQHQQQQQVVTLLATSANRNKTLAETISSVLGSRFLAGLMPITIDLSDIAVVVHGGSSSGSGSGSGSEEDDDDDDDQEKEEKDGSTSSAPLDSTNQNDVPRWKIEGWIAKAHTTTTLPQQQQRGVRTAQYYAINGRPVDLPQVTRLLNDLWRSAASRPTQARAKKPSCILHFTMPAASYDINLSPDKRQVMWTHETAILAAIRRAVSELWAASPTATNTFAMNQIMQSSSSSSSSSEQPKEDDHEDDSPGKFNRRYAFSHDFSKAKLQHEYDDGRVKRRRLDDDDDDDDDALTSSHCNTSADADQESRCRPAAEQVVTPSPPKTDDSNSMSSSAVDNDDKKVRWVERQQWRKTQATFNSNGPNEVVAANGKRPAEELSTQDNSNNNNTESSTGGGRFAQFGFRAAKRTRESQGSEVSAQTATTNQDLTTDNHELVSSQSRRVSDASHHVYACTASPLETTTTTKNTRRVSDQSTKTNVAVDAGTVTLDEKPDTATTTNSLSRAEHSTASVTWGAFQGTDQVISLARQHRLAMRDRKTTTNHQCSISTDDDDDDNNNNNNNLGRETVTLQKGDFKENLTVVGQFNMGFILAKSKDNHLWILDQHACDERFNFEKLCQETVIHEQRLMAPLPLELSPSEETCVMDHLGIFEKNGFRFICDETKPPRHRLSLVALPHSGAHDGRKAVQFGKEDVSALCAILAEDGPETDELLVDGGTGTDGTGVHGNNAVRRYAATTTGLSSAGGGDDDTADRVIARLPKAIAMFASRACRGSVMIGTAMSESEMNRIIRRLGDMKDPWHCAHGRSTLSHVGQLGPLCNKDERKASSHVAGPTVTVTSQMD